MGRRYCGWAGVVLVLAVVGRANADEPNAAALVRSVREGEAWIDRVESLWLKADVAWERTPEGIAKQRKQLQAQFPGQDLEGESNLQPRGEQKTELAFDRKRVRVWNRWPWGVEEVRIWDGGRYLGRDHPVDGARPDGCLIAPSPEGRFNALLNFSSFRTAHHPFWWLTEEERAGARLFGPPEEFSYIGREDFEGDACHVVRRWRERDRYYVSVADGRLRGLKQGALSLPRFNDPVFGRSLEDYREIAPGCWLPWKQTTIHYILDDQGRSAVDLKQTLTITEAHVDEPLPDALFQVDIKEGSKVIDETHKPRLVYRHKEKFTPEEWAAIVAEGEKKANRDEAYEQAQRALIGRPAPEFPAGAKWLNGDPLKWSDLAGKRVVLDFWAEWCGPCRNDLPTLSALHKKRDANGLVVIGVHPPGSKLEAIEKVMKEFDLGYPQCIDVPRGEGPTAWGRLFQQLSVDRIPHAVLVDRQGKIVLTGELNDVLLEALKPEEEAK